MPWGCAVSRLSGDAELLAGRLGGPGSQEASATPAKQMLDYRTNGPQLLRIN